MTDIEMTAGEKITPDAGESTHKEGSVQEVPSTDTKKSFDELIEGEYRREYGERVEAIVKGRLKHHAETKQKLNEITEMLLKAGSDLGVEGDDPRQIIEGLVAARKNDNSEAEGADPVNNKEGDKKLIPDPATVDKVRAMAERVKEAREYYPDFDISKELRDPEFTMLLAVCRNDPKRAYEMKYHDRIITDAMHYAVTHTEQRLSDNLAKRTVRPTENAAAGSSAVMISTDPKTLTRQQRSDIKKRVRRGEKIRW